jgi:hypothetical protein
MKNILQRAFPIIALAGCFTLTGCFKNFYTVKTNTGYENLEPTIVEKEKKIIVHYTDDIVAFSSPTIDAEKITGKITHYMPARPTYTEPDESRRLQPYKYKHHKTLFKEVHVYANIPRPNNTYLASVTKEQVVKYNTYKPAKGASIGSHVLGGVLIAATLAGIVAAVAASTAVVMGSMSFAIL